MSWSLTRISSRNLLRVGGLAQGGPRQGAVRQTRAKMSAYNAIRALAVVLLIGAALPAAAQSSGDRPFDVVLILDNSGSMKHNDPTRLMPASVAAFADRMPADSALAVVLFDTTARVTIGLTTLTDTNFRTGLDRALGQVDYKGQRTDIPGAVERALYELRDHGRSGARRAIVLFTDGFVDLGDERRNRSRASWLTSDLVAEAERENVMIFGIAFTEQADFELMKTVSEKPKTGGTYFRLLSSSDISGVFRQITDRIRQLHPQAAPKTNPLSGGDTSQTGSNQSKVILLWALGGLVFLLAAAGVWAWRERALAPPVPATLQNCRTANVYTIDKRVFRIGKVRFDRVRKNDLVIPEPTVSRSHAQIRYRAGEFYLRDDGSRNHTFLARASNPARPLVGGKPEKLKDGDIVRFDAFEFRFGAVTAQVMRGIGRKGTEAAPELPRVPEGGGGTMPPEPIPNPPKPKREETIPPPGFEASVAPSAVPETCLRCDRVFSGDKMTNWAGFRICLECDADAQSLPTAQVASYKKELETKRRRRAVTADMK